MADLTDDGYLEQPHTSAGRVPTARPSGSTSTKSGRERPTAPAQKRRIASILSSAGLELGNILRQTSRLLSVLSLQVAMVVAPRHADTRWKRIDVSLLKPRSGHWSFWSCRAASCATGHRDSGGGDRRRSDQVTTIT